MNRDPRARVISRNKEVRRMKASRLNTSASENRAPTSGTRALRKTIRPPLDAVDDYLNAAGTHRIYIRPDGERIAVPVA